jgi:hypothetical protein
MAELVARATDHHQPALAMGAPQRFQPRILRGEAAARSHVHHQQGTAAPLRKRQGRPVDARQHETECIACFFDDLHRPSIRPSTRCVPCLFRHAGDCPTSARLGRLTNAKETA